MNSDIRFDCIDKKLASMNTKINWILGIKVSYILLSLFSILMMMAVRL